jgi:glycosyltransferase involved in cell wall biosynthesis
MALTPGVMLVTGAYYPEISSSGQQCRAVARELGDRVRFSVIATAVDRTLPSEATVDGVRVFRLPIDVASLASRAVAFLRLAWIMLRERARFDIVHLHGVSAKNVPVTSLARMMGKRIVVTMHTAGQDEPQAVAARGGDVALGAFKQARIVLSVSPVLSQRYRDAGFPVEKLRDTINGIDIERFRPATESERVAIRERLELPAARTILFVGFFSRDKRPNILFDAWRKLAETVREPIALVFVGATTSPYFEIDRELAPWMRRAADADGLSHLLRFVEFTNEIEEYYRAADVFVLPSVREALPMSLLEAMATGLPSVATHLPGATDAIIEDGKTGMLFEADEVQALASDLRELFGNPAHAWEIGAAARSMIESRFTVGRAAADWLAAYEHVLQQH